MQNVPQAVEQMSCCCAVNGLAQVTCEFGGSDEQKLLLIRLHCFTDSLAVMVTDAKGRIQFATTQLASMVGYSAKVLTDGMNIAGLLPPPYSQLHPGYMKVGTLSGVVEQRSSGL
jgi:hypothetical protein